MRTVELAGCVITAGQIKEADCRTWEMGVPAQRGPRGIRAHEPDPHYLLSSLENWT